MKEEISGTVTKAVPFRDAYGRYGLTVTAKTEKGYLHANVLEPGTKVIIRGNEVTFKGQVTKAIDYGTHKVKS